MTSFPSKKSLIFLLVLFFVTCWTFEDVCVDVNDILSPNWMPGTILEHVGSNEYSTSFNKSDVDFNSGGRALDGTINNALDTMIFHRSMINQYLCRSYVANQILSEVTKTSFKRRMSDPDANAETPENIIMEKEKLKPNIMLDQGSSSYEDWLKKSSTLDDIYRNHNKMEKLNDDDTRLSKSEMDETVKKAPMSTKVDVGYQAIPEMPGHFYGGAHHRYEPTVYFAYPPFQGTHVQKNYKKSDKLSDIIEIALTTLAYLSFGVFIVHLIMSICAVTNTQTTTTDSRRILNLDLAAIDTDSYEQDDGDIISEPSFEANEDKYKYRSIEPPMELTKMDTITANQIAKRVLKIFDSALMADKDGGQCFRNSLCNATKYSRYLDRKSKLYMGLWSFGISWLSDRISNQVVSKTESLQAILFGLGMANCDNIYQNCLLEPKEVTESSKM